MLCLSDLGILTSSEALGLRANMSVARSSRQAAQEAARAVGDLGRVRFDGEMPAITFGRPGVQYPATYP
jgi:hypothetical protein